MNAENARLIEAAAIKMAEMASIDNVPASLQWRLFAKVVEQVADEHDGQEKSSDR